MPNSFEWRTFLKNIIISIAPIGSRRYQIVQWVIEWMRPLRQINRRYTRWIKQYDAGKGGVQQNRQMGLMETPLFSIIMPVYNPNQRFFHEALQSVLAQAYPHWELCIADDASDDPAVTSIIKSYARKDPRIKYVLRPENGHISAASNSALALASGDFVALLDHDDQLHPFALLEAVKVINQHPDCEIIYSDEDKITRYNRRIDPYFKSDFDYDLALNHNMVIHLGIYRHATVKKIGGFRVGYEGSQDYDLVLRMIDEIGVDKIFHIPRVLYHWRMSVHSAAGNIQAKPYAAKAAMHAIQDHFERTRNHASVDYVPEFAIYHPKYNLPAPLPSVEIIIWSFRLTNIVIEGIEEIIENTLYDHFKIKVILEDDTIMVDTLSLQPFLADHRVEILFASHIHSRHEAINRIGLASTSDYICLVEAGMRGFTMGWLGELVGQGSQPGVGAVGVKLTNPDGKIYSNGILLGLDRLATHFCQNLPHKDPGYLYWAVLQKGYSALSSACILVRCEHFRDVGGVDLQLSDNDLKDVDFCLKLRKNQLRNVLVPTVELTLSEPEIDPVMMRKSSPESDRQVMENRWGKWITYDPYFNPNLMQNDHGEVTVKL